jgi:hypothetical protein
MKLISSMMARGAPSRPHEQMSPNKDELSFSTNSSLSDDRLGSSRYSCVYEKEMASICARTSTSQHIRNITEVELKSSPILPATSRIQFMPSSGKTNAKIDSDTGIESVSAADAADVMDFQPSASVN